MLGNSVATAAWAWLRRSRLAEMTLAVLVGAAMGAQPLLAAAATPPGPSGTAAPRPAASPDAPPAKSQTTLLADLQAELGTDQPIAVVFGVAGMVAQRADGAKRRVLHVDPVEWAEVDWHAHVIWFRERADPDKLWLLDLATPQSKPLAVVKGLETVGNGMGCTVRISYGKAAVGGYSTGFSIELDLEGRQPKLSLSTGSMCTDTESDCMRDSQRDFKKKVKLIGGTKLAALSLRAKGATALSLPPAASSKLSVPNRCEEDEDVCGKHRVLPGTGMDLVTVGYSCGDSCYTSLVLWQSSSRRFLVPAKQLLVETTLAGDEGEVSGSFSPDGWLARDTTFLLLPDVLINTKDLTTQTLAGNAAGWLWPAYSIEAP